MKTTAALLIDRCGLSAREAVEFLSARLDTVKSWSSGRNNAPPGVIAELRALYRKIETAASRACEIAEQAPQGAAIELGLASDDHEAQSLGLPCVGAHAALLGIVAARMDRPVLIVPRGTTMATAAAIEAHEG